VDALEAACHDGQLALFALQGHELYRVARGTAPGARFGPARRVTTAAARLGPVAPDAVDGPVAWRAPLAGVDSAEGPEHEELWVATGAEDFRLGALGLAPDAFGLGVVVPLERLPGAVTVLASHARHGQRPESGAFNVQLGRLPGAPDGVPAVPAERWPAELLAYEFQGRRALYRAAGQGAATLEVRRLGEPGVLRAEPLGGRQLLTVARGAAAGEASVFAQSEFTVESGGGCLRLAPDLCVRPGRVGLLVATREALTRVTVAPSGLPDSVAAVGSRVWVLYLAADATGAHAQHAAVVTLPHGTPEELRVQPPEGMPAVDHPMLVPCGDTLWLAATMATQGDGGGGDALAAFPLACIAR
jgi:hypothetical protein